MERLMTKVGKAGGMLVGGLLLGSVIFSAQPAQAQVTTAKSEPSCPTSTQINSINDDDNTDDIDGLYQGSVSVDIGEDSDFSNGFGHTFATLPDSTTAISLPAGKKHYFKITLPP